MIRRERSRSARRWLLPLVVVLLVFGHVCELPAYASLVGTLHSTEDRSADGHEHDSEWSCDPVDAVSTTTPVQVPRPTLDITEMLPVPSSVPGGLGAPSSFEPSKRFASRPPLFVLYASLLI
jgi:hypothetical protein